MKKKQPMDVSTRNLLILMVIMVGFPLSAMPAQLFIHSAVATPTVTHVSTAINTPSLTCLPPHCSPAVSSEPTQALDKLVAYQYGTPCTTGLTCSVTYPKALQCPLLTCRPKNANISVTSGDFTVYQTLASENVLNPNGAYFNYTMAIDYAGAQRAGVAMGLTTSSFYGSNGIISSIYGGPGPSSNLDGFFNISQSAVLHYGSPAGPSATGGPNVATGVSFYAEALDGSSSVLQATLSCSAGFGNSITGYGGSVTTDIPVNPGNIFTPSNASLITATGGLVAIHFPHYLWCGDVNDSVSGPFLLKLTILPWTIDGAVVGGGTSGTVTFSRVVLGQEATDTLSSSSSSMPAGSIPEFIPANGMLRNGTPPDTYNVNGVTAATLLSGYRSNYGFSVNENDAYINTLASNGGCPPSFSLGSTTCQVNEWNAYGTAVYVPSTTQCMEQLSITLSDWSVNPSPFYSTDNMGFFAIGANHGATCIGNTLKVSSVFNTYTANGGVMNQAFVVPTTLFGYMGTKNPIDGGIAFPASVSMSATQRSILASHSFLNVSWWDSALNPLIGVLNPTNAATTGTGGGMLSWHIPIYAGNTTAASFNAAHPVGPTNNTLQYGILSSSPGGCPVTHPVDVTGPEFPNPSLVSPGEFWSSNPTNVSPQNCVPMLYFQYTPSLPMPVGYNFYQYNTPIIGDSLYTEGQTVFADNYIFTVNIPGYSVRESFASVGLNGVLFPYAFPSLNGSLATKNYWWTTTQNVESLCPMVLTPALLPPSWTGFDYSPSGCTNTQLLNAESILSDTPTYGAGYTKTYPFISGIPRSDTEFNSNLPADLTSFSGHLPVEQVGGGFPLYALTFNLSLTSLLFAPMTQEFLVLMSPSYADVNLPAVSSGHCNAGGLTNTTLGGLQVCTSATTNITSTLIPPATWQPVQPSPLGLDLNLVAASPSAVGVPSNYVQPGPWTVRTSLSDRGYSSSFNSTCGVNDSTFYGPYPNLEATAYAPPPLNHSDISDPYWWSNTSTPTTQPQCANGYIDPYWAYSSNVHAGLLPFGNYTWNATAPSYAAALMSMQLTTDNMYNASLTLCADKYTNTTSSGCDLSKYNVYFISFASLNRSGGSVSNLAATYVSGFVNGSTPGSFISLGALDTSLNTTGCGPSAGFCNNVIMVLTPKASTFTLAFNDYLDPSVSANFNPKSNTTVIVPLVPLHGVTKSISVTYYWQPHYTSCQLSGTCGCLYNCGGSGLLAWLQTNIVALLIVLISALIVAGLAYYLHRKDDDQLAGLEIAGGSFIVAGLAWLSLMTNYNYQDAIWLALLITGASIMAPGASILLAARHAKRPTRASSRKT